MKLSVEEIRRFYLHMTIREGLWNFGRKHFRLETLNAHWVKLNRFENRIRADELPKHLVRYAPRHVYMSVTDWLMPERVGPKRKASHALPIGGEFVVDVDSYLAKRLHRHVLSPVSLVCPECLEISKQMTMDVGDRILENYSRIGIVFSGRRGFHIHVLDFNYADWTQRDERNPLKAMAAGRFKYALDVLPASSWDRSHFVLSVDPMRVVTVPETLNATTGLVCILIGDVEALERMSIHELLNHSSPASNVWGTDFVTVALSPLVAMKSSTR